MLVHIGMREALPHSPFLILNLCFDVINRVGRFDLQRDHLACKCFDEDLHPTDQQTDKIQCRLLLNVGVGERQIVGEQLAGEDKTLLVGRNAT